MEEIAAACLRPTEKALEDLAQMLRGVGIPLAEEHTDAGESLINDSVGVS